ncbi:Glycosyltransferase [Heracleum sosnowskyi]|uniref:Glycosyltransferase n=1 Tax=Heracleum sosnowskyi TaxID=360622 RepID=A0AAD8IYA8_9APIA|nr:Glycosyltransferase [Heracleum sosnowskyi]
MRAELIFIPSPGVGHLVSSIEVAKLIASRDEQISISILIMKMPFDSGIVAFTQNLKKDAPERIAFIDIPDLDDTTRTELMSLPQTSFFTSYIESQRTLVRDIVATILEQSESAKIGGFVIDMFCTSMIDVANEFNVPAYVFFTSGAAFLSLMFFIQTLKDNESKEISEYKDSDVELSIPGFINPLPVKVLPSMMVTKDGSAFIVGIARRLREAKAILVNTVWELEAHSIKSLADDENTPLIYHVGPIISFTTGGETTDKKKSEEDIVCWLNCQPPLSVVYLCFGSWGSFNKEQVTEMAQALELSGQRFLWSLRRPSQETEKMKPPTDYEDFNEVLPEGFLERTSGIGKLVKELGIAVEIKTDYGKDHFTNTESAEVLTADVIERGIRCLMDGESQVRSKMKEMKGKCREATGGAGSSYTSLGQFIGAVMDNIQEEAFN